MKAKLFVGGVLLTAAFGAFGLLLDAGSEKGIRFLQNDLIAIGLVGLLVGAGFAFCGWALEGPDR